MARSEVMTYVSRRPGGEVDMRVRPDRRLWAVVVGVGALGAVTLAVTVLGGVILWST